MKPLTHHLTTANLQISAAQCHRAGECLFKPISLQLQAGEMALISGPNGSGKTTLMEAIAGLCRLSAGEIWYNGQQSLEDWLSSSHYLGHKLGNKGNLTCAENLRFIAQVNQVAINAETTESVLDQIGLAGYEYHYANDLSAGQKKRLALGRLLLLNKRFWLLDEPFVNLDQAGCDWLYQIIKSHLNSAGSVLITAHDQKEIQQLAQHHIALEAPGAAA